MENLKGKNIISRMGDLMSYGNFQQPSLNAPNKVTSNVEFTLKAPNGITYGIVKENAKFYIKESKNNKITPEDFSWMGGIINGTKKSYNSYAEAYKVFNLMLVEINSTIPNPQGINLFEHCGQDHNMEEGEDNIDEAEKVDEEDDLDEKTVLKVPQPQAAQPQQRSEPAGGAGFTDFDNAPAQDSSDGGDLDLGNDTEDLGGDNLDLGGEEGDLDLGNEEGAGSEEKKVIQKLTGKLGQKMRDIEQPDGELTKYVFNSTISSLDLNSLDDADKKDITKKFKKKLKGDEDEEDLGLDDETGDEFTDQPDETNDEELGENMFTKKKQTPQSQFDTGWVKNPNEMIGKGDRGFGDDDKNKSKEKNKEGEIDEGSEPFGEKKEPQNIKSKNAPFNEKPTKLKTESKARQVISKYFDETDSEKQADREQFLNETLKKVQILTEGKEKCLTIEQELSLTTVFDYDNNFKIKTMNENVIVDTNHSVNIGGKEYAKLIMVETTGKVTGILKDIDKKTATQYRMNNKNDYKNFIELGK